VKKKPKGPRFRNLTARGRVIYYQRRVTFTVEGAERVQRYRFSCETDDWEVAAAMRDEFEARKGIGKFPFLSAPDVPTLAGFADRYLDEDTEHLAPATRADRKRLLAEGGPILPILGSWKLDEITPAALRDWWNLTITGKGLSVATGRSYLATLAGLFGYAQDLGLMETSPVGTFREQIRRRSRTQRARAESQPGREVRPIETPAELRRFVVAANQEALVRWGSETRETGQGGLAIRDLEERTAGVRARVAVLAMLDAGLRVGEVAGLTWGQVRWGESEDDPGRALVIDRSRPRGREVGPPKSGRTRVVAISRRLRRALEHLQGLQFRPGLEAPVLPGFEPHNFASRPWRLILDRAKIGHRSPKDLRDTYASWLLSLGVQLGYVSQQLGHSDVAVTARHYARWCGGNVYRDPMKLAPGEVPADLLARIVEERPHSDPTLEEACDSEIEKVSDLEGLVVAQARIELATPAFSVRCSTN